MRNLGRTCPDIPHPKSDMACRIDDDNVVHALVIKEVVIEADVAHDLIHKTSRKVCFAGVMDLTSEIGWQPHRDIGRRGSQLEIKPRAGNGATLHGNQYVAVSSPRIRRTTFSLMGLLDVVETNMHIL